jgi:hypothetical protein
MRTNMTKKLSFNSSEFVAYNIIDRNKKEKTMYFYGDTLRKNNYLRKEAVRYALNYALNPNPAYRYIYFHGDGGGDCSNFVSQCLRAGGAPMDFDFPRPWWYKMNGSNNVNKHTWSISWATAHSLYWCLKVRNQMNLPGLKGAEIDDIDLLEAGDIIQYENYNGIIYHSAIITDFIYDKGMRLPLISQHTFNALNISHIKPAAKKMHLMKIKI